MTRGRGGSGAEVSVNPVKGLRQIHQDCCSKLMVVQGLPPVLEKVQQGRLTSKTLTKGCQIGMENIVKKLRQLIMHGPLIDFRYDGQNTDWTVILFVQRVILFVKRHYLRPL